MIRILFWNTNEGAESKRKGIWNYIAALQPEVVFLFEAYNFADDDHPFVLYICKKLKDAGYQLKWKPETFSPSDKNRRTIFASKIKGTWDIDDYGREGAFFIHENQIGIAGIHPYSAKKGPQGVRNLQKKKIEEFSARNDIKFIGGDFNQENTAGDIHRILTHNYHSISGTAYTYKSSCIDWVYQRSGTSHVHVEKIGRVRSGQMSDHSALVLTI